MQHDTSAGYVALIGAPNTGKSTLINALVGAKVSIVTPKVQTTRRRIIGITIHHRCQIMFVDTPGVFEAKRRLDRAMVGAAWAGAADADLTLFLIDARRGLDGRSRHIKNALLERGPKIFAVINKIDLVAKSALLALSSEINDGACFAQTFMISALTADGLPSLLDAITATLPHGPWLYPEDQLSDLSNRAMAAEITREKLFLALQDELPYTLTVETDGWTVSKSSDEIRIDQTIYVARPTQKAIVLGRGGRQIKSVGQAARMELEKMLSARVHLFLFIKVRERWADDPDRYRELGLNFPQ